MSQSLLSAAARGSDTSPLRDLAPCRLRIDVRAPRLQAWAEQVIRLMALRALMRGAPVWLRPSLTRRLASGAELEELDAAPRPDPLKHAPSVFDKMCALLEARRAE